MDISDVFTPREPKVNPAMYVDRGELETSLKRAVTRKMHALLFGDSGNGKSWLYKKVLADCKIPYKVANCANASRIGSLKMEICSALVDSGTATKRTYSEETEAGISAVFAEANIKHIGNFELKGEEPLLAVSERFWCSTIWSLSSGLHH